MSSQADKFGYVDRGRGLIIVILLLTIKASPSLTPAAQRSCVCQRFSEPLFGVARQGSPRFVLTSPFSPIFSHLGSLFSRFAPICSDIFRFALLSSDLFQEQNRTNQGNPFLPTPFCKSPILGVALRELKGGLDFGREGEWT